MPLSAWLPLQTAAGAFREECSSLEQLVQELFSDIERLGQELESKADELEEGRRHLAERGRQLAEQRKESTRLSHHLEQQETQLSEALGELRELRAELASRADSQLSQDSLAELANLRKLVADLQVEKAVLQERLEAANQARSSEQSSGSSDSATADLLRGLTSQFAGEFAHLKERLAASQANAPPAELMTLKHDLLERLDRQFSATAAELQEFRAEIAQRPELPSPLPAVESLGDQLGERFQALEDRIQSLQRESPEFSELNTLKQERQELELELELVRARSAELQETVSRQKRELAAQQMQVSDELKELRSLIAEQGEHISHHDPSATMEPSIRESSVRKSTPPTPAPAASEEAAKPNDPVVNSVMAQFAKLQRDIAQRRKKK